MGSIGSVALIALGGVLAGGTYSTWSKSRALAAALGVCAVLAVAGGVLRLGYF